jgi:hypothetical protein
VDFSNRTSSQDLSAELDGGETGLDYFDLEGQSFELVVHELDGRPLVVLGVCTKHPHLRAVVDRGVLVVTLPETRYGLNKLDGDRNALRGQGHLVALPTLGVALVALGGPTGTSGFFKIRQNPEGLMSTSW